MFIRGRFNYEGLVPHKQYFAATNLSMSSCASYASCSYDVIDDVTRSQGRPNFDIAISPPTFKLEHKSTTQNIEILMAIWVVYSFSDFAYGKKNCVATQNGGHLENVRIFQTILDIKRWSQIMRDTYFSWL